MTLTPISSAREGGAVTANNNTINRSARGNAFVGECFSQFRQFLNAKCVDFLKKRISSCCASIFLRIEEIRTKLAFSLEIIDLILMQLAVLIDTAYKLALEFAMTVCSSGRGT